MKFSTNKKLRFKATLVVAVLALIIGLVALAGCTSYGFAPKIPADHFEGNSTSASIEYNHSRCGGCHEGTSGAFSMNASDSLSAHAQAWSSYQSDSDMDEVTRQQISDNLDNMQKYFSENEGSDCMVCHQTTVEKTGFVVGEIKVNEFCGECHDQTEVIAATVDWDPELGANPHESHADEEEELTCNSCHQFHSAANTLYCNECHDFALPEGWIAPPAASQEEVAAADKAVDKEAGTGEKKAS